MSVRKEGKIEEETGEALKIQSKEIARVWKKLAKVERVLIGKSSNNSQHIVF